MFFSHLTFSQKNTITGGDEEVDKCHMSEPSVSTIHKTVLSWVSIEQPALAASPLLDMDKMSGTAVDTIAKLLAWPLELLLSSRLLRLLPLHPLLWRIFAEVLQHHRFTKACRNLKSLKNENKMKGFWCFFCLIYEMVSLFHIYTAYTSFSL